MLKDELVDWIPVSVVGGAWLLTMIPFPEPSVGTVAVDDEVFAEVMVCSKDSSCERSKVRNLS